MNLNKLAKEITLREGGKKSLTVAQVKEVLRHLGDMIHEDWQGGLDIFSRLHRAASKRSK